jgi:hypothetical protein
MIRGTRELLIWGAAVIPPLAVRSVRESVIWALTAAAELSAFGAASALAPTFSTQDSTAYRAARIPRQRR